MLVNGFSEEEQLDIFRIVAAVLHLGNVTYTVDDKDNISIGNQQGTVSHAILC